MAELIKEHAGVEMHPSMPVEDARAIADRFGVDWLDVWGAGKIMAEVYDETSEAKLIEPTFVMDHPARGLAAGPRPPRRPDADRALRARRRGPRARQRLLASSTTRSTRRSASRPRRSCRRAATRRPSRSTTTTSSARVRAAADRRARDRHRPAGDAARRRRHDPRRHPLPDPAARGRGADGGARATAIDARRRPRPPRRRRPRRSRRRRAGRGRAGARGRPASSPG